MSIFYSLFYSLTIGCLFVYLFIFAYDFLYGEKYEKQIKKIHKHFRNEVIKKVDILDHEPKKFTIFQVITDTGKKKIKIKPGYKIVKLVAKK